MENKELEKLKDIKDMTVMFDKLPALPRQRILGIAQGCLCITEIEKMHKKESAAVRSRQ